MPHHPRLSGVGGHPTIRSPRRDTSGRIIRNRNYRRFTRRRAVAEHTVARLKDHRILRQCRSRGPAVDHAIAGAATLHNLNLDIP